MCTDIIYGFADEPEPEPVYEAPPQAYEPHNVQAPALPSYAPIPVYEQTYEGASIPSYEPPATLPNYHHGFQGGDQPLGGGGDIGGADYPLDEEIDADISPRAPLF